MYSPHGLLSIQLLLMKTGWRWMRHLQLNSPLCASQPRHIKEIKCTAHFCGWKGDSVTEDCAKKLMQLCLGSTFKRRWWCPDVTLCHRLARQEKAAESLWLVFTRILWWDHKKFRSFHFQLRLITTCCVTQSRHSMNLNYGSFETNFKPGVMKLTCLNKP